MIKQLIYLTGYASLLIFAGTGCQQLKNLYAHKSPGPIDTQPTSVLVTNDTQTVIFNVVPSSKILGTQNYQWFFNGAPIDAATARYLNIERGTETSQTLKFQKASTNAVGFYECAIEHDNPANTKERLVALSEEAELLVSHHSVLTVFGTPVGGGSPSSQCPPPYIGYVTYRLPSSPYGWYFTKGGTVTDPSGRKDTVIAYFGSPLTNYGCTNGPTLSVLPNSCAYVFAIYFKSKPMPSGAYPIQLNPNP